jgi:LuxR family maltose regulon positive regulatory protein
MAAQRTTIEVPTADPYFGLAESKLDPPEMRAGIVERTALVNRLVAASSVPIVAVVAPPGYGKTTLLAQWAERRRPSPAWLSCDDGDNDPTALLTYLAAAVARVGPISPDVYRMLASSGGGVTAVPRFLAGISPSGAPVALILDHVEAITNPDSLDTIAEMAVRLPPDWQLVLASRHPLPLPVGRLRAQGRIVEIGADDLAMNPAEADALLAGLGVDPAEANRQTLLERTEGWAISLYLAGLAMRAGTEQRATGFTFTGGERYLGAYLRSELLDRASDSERSFLLRTSVLGRMTGALCDATLDRTGSARVLEQLEGRNLLVVPLDRRREWYRYHHLFRRLLHAELRRREPGIVQDLHSRAAAWFEANGMPGAAIEHAQAGGDTDQVAQMVLDLIQPVWASGRVGTVLRWMAWFEDRGVLERYPAIAVHGALIFALLGDAARTQSWAAVAERAYPAGTLADGSTMGGLLAYLRAMLARDGVEAMRQDSRIGLEQLSPDSPYRATMIYTEGVSYLLDADLDAADPILASAFDAAVDADSRPLAALVLAERSIVAIDRHDWAQVDALTARAVSMVVQGHFENYWTSALVYALAARAALHRGEVEQTRQHLTQAARLRPLLTYPLPVVSVQTLLEMASAYMTLADAGGAEAVLRQAEDILRERPELGVLPIKADQLRSRLDRIAQAPVGASSLTTAELRLLPLLATHLSLGEIAERFHVSRNTVKTQAGSLYRKLGASSRREAISRAHELGLSVI